MRINHFKGKLPCYIKYWSYIYLAVYGHNLLREQVVLEETVSKFHALAIFFFLYVTRWTAQGRRIEITETILKSIKPETKIFSHYMRLDDTD